MSATDDTAGRRIADSVQLTLIARAAVIATPFLLSIIGALIWSAWTDLIAYQRDTRRILDKLSDRVLVIETKTTMIDRNTKPLLLPPPDDSED